MLMRPILHVLLVVLLPNLVMPSCHAFNLDTRIRVQNSASVSVPNPPFIISNNDDGVSREKQSKQTQDAESVALSQYMTLPVEQYALVPMPLNSTLSRMPGGETKDFELLVPPVTFLWLDVQPVVHAIVTLEEDRVRITGDSCKLRGSPFISRVRLNERFSFNVEAELTWNDTFVANGDDESARGARTSTPSLMDDDGGLSAAAEGRASTAALVSESPSELSTGPPIAAQSSTIFARTRIEVDVDVPRPFSAVPRKVIERTGDKAMQISLNYILRSFMKGLAGDYQRWAGDPEYRKYRSELALEQQQEEKK